jgi:hypothetical protein
MRDNFSLKTNMDPYSKFKSPGDSFNIVIDFLEFFAMTFKLLLYFREREYLLQIHPMSL